MFSNYIHLHLTTLNKLHSLQSVLQPSYLHSDCSDGHLFCSYYYLTEIFLGHEVLLKIEFRDKRKHDARLRRRRVCVLWFSCQITQNNICAQQPSSCDHLRISHGYKRLHLTFAFFGRRFFNSLSGISISVSTFCALN